MHTVLGLQVAQPVTSQIKLQAVPSVLREYPESQTPQVVAVAQVAHWGSEQILEHDDAEASVYPAAQAEQVVEEAQRMQLETVLAQSGVQVRFDEPTE